MRALFFNQHEKWRTGWRIVAMFALVGAAVVLINVLWRATGQPGRLEGGAWYFAVFSAAISGSTFGIILLLLRFFEDQGSSSIGMPIEFAAWKAIGAGLLLGAAPISLVLLLAVVAGYGTVSFRGFQPWTLLPMMIAWFLLAAWEEVVLRGYLLRQLALGLNRATAIGVTGVLFDLLHSANPGATWQGLLYTAVGGILMGWLVLRSGSLWLLIGYHFGWNTTASGILGLELSGFREQANVFESTLSGPDWLTGGSYGFEGSLPACVFEVLLLLAVLWALRARGAATNGSTRSL